MRSSLFGIISQNAHKIDNLAPDLCVCNPDKGAVQLKSFRTIHEVDNVLG